MTCERLQPVAQCRRAADEVVGQAKGAERNGRADERGQVRLGTGAEGVVPDPAERVGRCDRERSRPAASGPSPRRLREPRRAAASQADLGHPAECGVQRRGRDHRSWREMTEDRQARVRRAPRRSDSLGSHRPRSDVCSRPRPHSGRRRGARRRPARRPLPERIARAIAAGGAPTASAGRFSHRSVPSSAPTGRASRRSRCLNVLGVRIRRDRRRRGLVSCAPRGPLEAAALPVARGLVRLYPGRDGQSGLGPRRRGGPGVGVRASRRRAVRRARSSASRAWTRPTASPVRRRSLVLVAAPASAQDIQCRAAVLVCRVVRRRNAGARRSSAPRCRASQTRRA